MALVKCGDDITINPAHVSSMMWDRGHTYTSLIIALACGREIRIRHQPTNYGGTDCYQIERDLIAGAAGQA